MNNPTNLVSPWRRRRVPLELADMIIDHLHDDTQSLAACSLVSREWRPSTRYHLFKSIRIRGDALYGGYDSFLRFLDDSPAIRPYIRALCLSGSWKSMQSSGEHCLLGPYVLLTVLDLLTALHTLTLEYVVWSTGSKKSAKGLWPVTWPPTPRSFGSLQLRSVESYDLGPPQYTRSMFQILQVFGPLQKLHISDIEFDAMSWNNIARLDVPSSLAVEEFSIEDAHTSQAFVVGLRKTRSINTLSSMKLHCTSVSDAHSFGTLIRDAADTIKHLDVDVCHLTRIVATPSVAETMRSLNISSCAGLTSLHLHVCIHPRWSAPSDLRSGWTFVASILLSLPSSVQTLDIRLTPPPTPHEDAVEVGLDHFFRHIRATNWGAITAGLQKCKDLKSVNFALTSNTTTKRQFSQAIVKNLPFIHDLGVLHFS